MKQKFPTMSFVKVSDEMSMCMSHFPKDFIGIVHGSFSQLYGGSKTDEYILWKIENGRVVDRLAWYPESVLTLCEEQDRIKAEEMVEEYNLGD